jgi:hypothetical protein
MPHILVRSGRRAWTARCAYHKVTSASVSRQTPRPLRNVRAKSGARSKPCDLAALPVTGRIR